MGGAEDEPDAALLGAIIALGGSAVSLSSFTEAGQAGEQLQAASRTLE